MLQSIIHKVFDVLLKNVLNILKVYFILSSECYVSVLIYSIKVSRAAAVNKKIESPIMKQVSH